MSRHTQTLDKQIDAPEKRQGEEELKSDIDEPTEEHREDEGQNLVVGDRGAEDADRHEAGAQQEQTDIRSHDSTAVKVAHRHAQTIDREIIHRCGNQSEQHQGDTGKELRQDNLPIRQWFGEQHFDRARTVFLRETAHGDRRNQEEENPRSEDEQPIKVSVTIRQQIEIGLKNPKKKPRDQQKDHNDHDANQRTNEIADFFLIKCVHYFTAIKAAKIQIILETPSKNHLPLFK